MNDSRLRKGTTTPVLLLFGLALSAAASFPSSPLQRRPDSSTPGPSSLAPATNTTTLNPTSAVVTPQLSLAQPGVQTSQQISQNSSLDGCAVYPLDQSTWRQFGWDDYLRTYPNGANLTVESYAASKGAANFKCGIGENCNIGQLCSPVKAPDWYILYAAQNLNIYLNTLHEVAGEALSFTQGTIASVWGDLYPALIDHSDLTAVFAIGATAAAIQTIGFLFLLIIPDPALLFITTPFAVMSVINLTFTKIMLASLGAICVAQGIFSFHKMDGPLQSQEFNHWSQFNYRLSKWQEETQKLIRNATAQVFQSGLNLDPNYSISSILANGTFLSPLERKNTFEIQADLKNVTTSLALSRLLRAMNAFVTIDNDPHPDKRWLSKDVLSYQSPNGTLMNIIRAVPGKTKAINDFKNGHTLAEKHGFSPEYIATISYECQQRFGVQKSNPQNITEIHSLKRLFLQDPTVCSFDLPVCDLRLPELRAKKHKHKRTVKICREVLGLPI